MCSLIEQARGGVLEVGTRAVLSEQFGGQQSEGRQLLCRQQTMRSSLLLAEQNNICLSSTTIHICLVLQLFVFTCPCFFLSHPILKKLKSGISPTTILKLNLLMVKSNFFSILILLLQCFVLPFLNFHSSLGLNDLTFSFLYNSTLLCFSLCVHSLIVGDHLVSFQSSLLAPLPNSIYFLRVIPLVL